MDERAETPHGAAQSRTEPMPWRVLVLDASGNDPLWLIASVTTGSDVRTAEMRNGRYTDWAEVRAWVKAQVGQNASMTPVSAVVWRIEQ